MGYVGGDAMAMFQFAGELERRRRAIEDATRHLGELVEKSNWVGPDRDAFVSEWQGRHAPSLRAVVHELGESASAVVRHAKNQEEASR